jgi:hydrogenase maturation protease
MDSINNKKTILLAIGNSGRKDDGLGWAFAEDLENSGLFQGEIHFRFQLQVEDAELISNADRVVFVDAHKGKLENGFELQPCFPSREFHFSTHAIAPSSILYLCNDVYDRLPEAWLLIIEGMEWGIGEGLSRDALRHLDAAKRHFVEKIRAN